MNQAYRLNTPYARVKIGSDSFQTGDGFLESCQVTLGENEGASIVRFTIRDTLMFYANKYFEYSQSIGGLLDPTAKSQPGTSTTSGGGSGNVAGGGHAPGEVVAAASEFSPRMNAMLDTIAYGEGTSGPEGYRTMFTGRKFSSYSAHPRQLNSGGGYTSDAAGRYQFLSTTWQPHANALGLKDFGPQNQDRAAVREITEAGAADEIESGNVKAAMNILSPIWVSLPGPSGTNQPQKGEAEMLAYYQKRLTYYQQGGKSANTATQSTNSTPVTTQTTGGTVIENAAKGANIEIELSVDANQWVRYGPFVHTGTHFTGLENNTTTFEGIGVRWILTRRVQNRRWEGQTLKAIATHIAKEHKLGLVMEESGPTFESVGQYGISDLTLLNNLCLESGFRLYESGKELYIERRMPGDGFIIVFGEMGDTVSMVDKAQSEGDADDKSDPGKSNDSSTGRVVYEVSGATGKKEQKQPEVKTAAGTKGQAGSNVKPLKPVVTPQTEQAMMGQRDASRRVKGFQTSIDFTTTQAALVAITPDTPLRLQNLMPFADRAWVVEAVTHAYDRGALRTTVRLYTPMRSKIAKTAASSSTTKAAGPNPPSYGGWALPMAMGNNSIQAPAGLYGAPRDGGSRPHNGIDVGSGDPPTTGDTVFAMGDGQVVATDPSGWGMVIVKRPDGWSYKYLHLASVDVVNGQQVKMGQVVGQRGGRGPSGPNAYAPHLHLEIFRPDGSSINPLTDTPGIPQGAWYPVV